MFYSQSEIRNYIFTGLGITPGVELNFIQFWNLLWENPNIEEAAILNNCGFDKNSEKQFDPEYLLKPKHFTQMQPALRMISMWKGALVDGEEYDFINAFIPLYPQEIARRISQRFIYVPCEVAIINNQSPMYIEIYGNRRRKSGIGLTTQKYSLAIILLKP